MKYDVFISYSSKDQKVVEGICGYLESRGIRCFVAYRDIPRGVVWAKAIVDALDESQIMVIAFTEDFNRSDQVDREIELAAEDCKPILTFRLSDTQFKGAKKYYLKNLNWIDAFPKPNECFGELYSNVCKLLGREEDNTFDDVLKSFVDKQDEKPATPTTKPSNPPTKSSNPIRKKVVEILVEHLGVEECDVIDNADFFNDLGCDSLDAVELIMAAEEEFGIAIPDETAENLRTVGDLINYLSKVA